MSRSVPADPVAQATCCATLVDEWVRLGLRHVVVAPGSRSTPMALALAERAAAGSLALHVAHDERTAAFLALGVGLATGSPAAVLCTSGTAATHFHAAVVEAHQAGVPLLVLTADRPPELQGVGAPQTIDQHHLYGKAVRWFHDLGVPDAASASSWRPIAQEAMVRTQGTNPGPVHLNLPLREPLVAQASTLPPVVERVPEPAVVLPVELDEMAERLDDVRGVIVAGRGSGDTSAIGELTAATGWPVLADPRSGAGHLDAAVRAFDVLLRHHEFARDHRPTVVVRLGELPASKVLGQWLAASGAYQVHVTARPVVIDPDGVVADRLVADPSWVCRSLAGLVRGATGTPWTRRWQRAESVAQGVLGELLDDAGAALTEPATARAVLRGLPDGANLVVASSMPVRDLEWYGGSRSGVTVHANRGANGIDGTIATATGVALATGAPTAVLLGDVALLHDASSLTALSRRYADVRIVVVDNDGGGIFSFLSQGCELPHERFEQLFGTPHGTDLLRLAEAHGLPAIDVVTVGDLQAELVRPGPRLLRVRSDRSTNVAVHDAIHRAVHDALAPPVLSVRGGRGR
jgi:2-succinyl-5-enolpyruvyl-6-hydroxy-3-cyclohexene-1-carboxylate synthase